MSAIDALRTFEEVLFAINICSKVSLKAIYTRQTPGRGGPYCIILTIYTDNNLDGSDKKWPDDQVWKVAFTLYLLGTRAIFNVRLQTRYCACDERNYYTSSRKNEETGPEPSFISGFGAIVYKTALKVGVWSQIIFVWTPNSVQ